MAINIYSLIHYISGQGQGGVLSYKKLLENGLYCTINKMLLLLPLVHLNLQYLEDNLDCIIGKFNSTDD